MPSLAPFDVNGTKEERHMTKKIALQSLDETDFSAEKKKKKDSKNKADDFERTIEIETQVKGIESLFPIQATTFDMVLDGSDLVGHARTGFDARNLQFKLSFSHMIGPDVVAAYEYIFIWDEDLGVEHFNGEKFTEEKPGWCSDPHVPPCVAEEVSIAYWQ
ncbi:hypothetical protein Patl1_16753 [Pistacia atlantica]|uniref:Uncharacterized protein n=1 Tax=Pistacia atlantica TaxID=434234 RepID=A0ACC1B5M5_9ROSI|nr:hypothetical protein Patl1_16753 [Pistacia atlantica]